jgi:hypothetical protein
MNFLKIKTEKYKHFLKFLRSFDKIVRIWILYTDLDRRVYNSDLRIRIQ